MNIVFIIDEPHQEPLGIGYLSSCLKRANHKVECIYLRRGINLYNEVHKILPEMVAFSVTTGSEFHYLDISKKLKEKYELISIFGGPHPTFSPEILKEEGVDAVIIGEGEEALVELIEKIQRKDSLKNIPNVYIKDGKEIITNPVRPLIDNLDNIPFPDREVFYKNPNLGQLKVKTFIAHRGCPYRCSYCFNKSFHDIYKEKGKIVRIRSVDNLIEEIKAVKKKYFLEFVRFVDDIFIFSKEWAEEFSKKYLKEIGLPFSCILRAELINKDIIDLLKSCNCYSICIGIESGDEYVLNHVLNRKITIGKIIEVCREIKKAGIKLLTTNIVGIPPDGIDADFKTAALNTACKVDYAWVSLLYPYAKTEIFKTIKDMGYTIDEFMPYSYFQMTPISFLKNNQIDNFHKLFSLFVEFPNLKFLINILIKTKNHFIFNLYIMIFGIWKAFCYEFRIYKTNTLTNFFSIQFIENICNYITLGREMMFKKYYSGRLKK